MPTGSLEERRKALEESFFQKFNEELREKLKAEREHEENRDQLARASGIRDPATLDALLKLGIQAGTVAALSLVPLVAVAWADGKLDDKERAAVLGAAEEAGLGPDSVAHQLLDGWLAVRPSRQLLEAWLHYVEALGEALEADERAAFKEDVLSRTRDVAESSGGFLGLGRRISGPEQAILDKIEGAL